MKAYEVLRRLRLEHGQTVRESRERLAAAEAIKALAEHEFQATCMRVASCLMLEAGLDMYAAKREIASWRTESAE